MDLTLQITFVIVAIIILVAGVMVVTVKNIIHAALWLISSFFGVGMLYLLLEAEFIAVAQVLIYVGAISVLMLFAIMLTRHVTGEGERQLYKRWWTALLVSALLFGGVLAPTMLTYEWDTVLPVAETDITLAGPVDLGKAFMGQYFIPFQMAAILLLVALTGAIVVAYEERARRRRVLTLAEELALRNQSETQAEKEQLQSTQQEGSS